MERRKCSDILLNRVCGAVVRVEQRTNIQSQFQIDASVTKVNVTSLGPKYIQRPKKRGAPSHLRKLIFMTTKAEF